MYGKTLNISYLPGRTVNVALGSDWLPAGSATMTQAVFSPAENVQMVLRGRRSPPSTHLEHLEESLVQSFSKDGLHKRGARF